MTPLPPKMELWRAGPEEAVSQEFLQGMVNRMMVSHHKYNKRVSLKENAARSDIIGNLQRRLEKYAETGNTEWLMDAANFAMIEFMHPSHPQAHFRATDSDESPGIALRSGGVTHSS